tara:strand:- start:695 stop:3592 length:2898 start_codon:yes stop_codon:yes gene_type:complete
MASEIRVNSLTNRSGLSTVSITDTGAVVAGLITATTFSGPLTGAVTGNVVGNVTGNISGTAGGLTGSPSITVANITATGNVSIGGTLTYEDVTNIDSVGIITAQSDVHVGAGLSVVGIITAQSDVHVGTGLSVVGITTTQSDVLVGRNLSVTSGISTVKTLDYTAIDTTISDTAVDVFIYDTSKDSDGGAWRKRTQHTSWYNETLGTATRGTRKEFPAVAVIVATEDDVIIYDGDDPDLPMWMIFESSDTGTPYDTHYLGRGSGFSGFHPSITSVAMLNGILVVGKDGDSGNYAEAYTEIRFISDSALHRDETSSSDMGNAISGRNGSAGGRITNLSYGSIADHDINDVAMTVLPNAPVDSATGLPIPTIAVATDGGVSVIKDDVSVVDITSSKAVNDVHLIHFDKSGRLYFAAQASSSVTDIYQFNRYVIPSSDISNNVYEEGADATYFSYATSGSFANVRPNFNARYNDGTNEDITSIVSNNDGGVVGNVNGLSLFAEDYSSQNDGMVAYATTSYNTGYMHGDIKGAFLSDTDTTNVTGTNLVTNGDFSGGTTGWTAEAGGTTIAVSSGVLNVTRSGSPTSGRMSAYQQVTGLTVGEIYVLTGKITAVSNAASIGISIDTAGTGLPPVLNDEGHYLSNDWVIANGIDSNTVPGTITVTFKAAQTSYYIGLGARNSASATASFDDISLRKAEYDRSINKKGLQIVGTITKSPVATGADLVAYSGFTNSNYLQQPPNVDMQTGTGEFSVAVWMKTTSTEENYEGLMYYNRPGSIGKGWQLMMQPNSLSKGVYFYVYGASAQLSASSVTGLNDGQWHQVVATHNNGSIQLFVDGTLKVVNYNVSMGSINDSQAQLHIGRWYGNADTSNYWWRGSLALARHSASAPSQEQIKKMYDDEKHLFRENAKCTFYGSSDAVTALAFDDDTNLLHVGTSSGRSDFQELRRINNTTTAVQTAITAQNEFIIEQ